MTDVTTLLAGIKTRAEKATEGPWEVSTGLADQSIIFMPDGYSFKVSGHPDSKFIAAARTDVPRLVAALEAVEEALATMVEHFREGLDPKNPQGMQHVANSNRAFGADCALAASRTAVVAALGEG